MTKKQVDLSKTEQKLIADYRNARASLVKGARVRLVKAIQEAQDEYEQLIHERDVLDEKKEGSVRCSCDAQSTDPYCLARLLGQECD